MMFRIHRKLADKKNKQTKINKTKQITKLACDIDWGYISYLALLFTSLLAIEGNFGHELQLIKSLKRLKNAVNRVDISPLTAE